MHSIDRRIRATKYCKYYKNIENTQYKFIRAVDRTFHDGNISYVSGIVNITAEDYDAMPSKFDGELLRTVFLMLPIQWTASSTK